MQIYFQNKGKEKNKTLLLSPVKVLWEDCVSCRPHSSSCLKDIPPNELKAACVFVAMLLVFLIAKNQPKTKAKQQNVFILGDINSQPKLFAPSDVEAQAVVVRGGEEVDDPAQSVVRAGLRGRVAALLHHHPPVNQVHPACTPSTCTLSQKPVHAIALCRSRVSIGLLNSHKGHGGNPHTPDSA